MPDTTPAVLDFELHREHLATLDRIAELRAAGDYQQLEEGRRHLKWLLEQVGALYDDCEQAVIATLPDGGAVIDGQRTTVKPGSVTRKFDTDKLVRRLVADQLNEPVISAEVGDVVGTLLRVFPMGTPRLRVLADLDVFFKDYVTEERTGRSKVVVEGEAA
jgi:hypothetical protein